MSQKITLLNMRCPTCGAALKAKDPKEPITCVYCGNTIVPIAETAASAGDSRVFSGTVRVEGIKTSSSALAYIEQFFEEYDWDAFVYSQSLSVDTIDTLISSLKSSSADDKHTWFACFQAAYTPYLKKVLGCQQILSSIIEKFKNDDLDAYSTFDAYKRIVAMLNNSSAITAQLEKTVAYAEKYGAEPQEVKNLYAQITLLKQLTIPPLYNSLEEIPDIILLTQEKNAKIAAELATRGIDAEQTYNQAKEFAQQESYVAALNMFLSLDGYADSEDWAEKLDKYYLLSSFVELGGQLYLFKQNGSDTDSTVDLYATENKKVLEKPIISDISKIITNFANILYYLDSAAHLVRFNLVSGEKKTIGKHTYTKKNIHLYGTKIYALPNKVIDYSDTPKKDLGLVVVDLRTGADSVLIDNIKKIISFTSNKLTYTARVPQADNQESVESTFVMNVDTLQTADLGLSQVQVEGFLDDYVVFTRNAPTDKNKNLFIRKLGENAPARLLEANIYEFCKIIAGKIFYYVGNSANKTLINCSPEGTGRQEWPLYVRTLLFEQGGWLYFVRRAGYTSVLCKARLDGSKYSIIASDIEEFVDIKNGYLYYINDDSVLVKVRMDGSNPQELCADVETVLSIKDDQVIFISRDDDIQLINEDNTYGPIKAVKSIYAVDFTGSGKRKLAYNIESASAYNENAIYFTRLQESNLKTLHRLDVATHQQAYLLSTEIEKIENSRIGFYIALMFAIFFGFLGLVFSAEDPETSTIFWILTVICALLCVPLRKKE